MNTNLVILILLIFGVISSVIALISWRQFFRFSTPSKNLADKIEEVQIKSRSDFYQLFSKSGYLAILGLVVVLYVFGWQVAIGYAIAILVFFSLSKAVFDLVGVRAVALIEAAKNSREKKALKRVQLNFGFLSTTIFLVLLTVIWGNSIDQSLYFGLAIAAIFLTLCLRTTGIFEPAVKIFSLAFELVVLPTLVLLSLGAFNFKINLDKPLTISVAIFISTILFYLILLRLHHIIINRAISSAKELNIAGPTLEKLENLQPRGKKIDKIVKWVGASAQFLMIFILVSILAQTLINLGLPMKFDFGNKMLMIALGIKILTLILVGLAFIRFRSRWQAILEIFIQTILLSTLLFVISPAWPLLLNLRMVIFAGIFCLSTLIAIFFGVIKNGKKI